MKNIIASAALLIFGLTLSVQHAFADVGIPPWSVPGSSANPGERDTSVRMVSENVLVHIDNTLPSFRSSDPTAQKWQEFDATQRAIDPMWTGYGETDPANHMAGRVEAEFIMRNQGEETEAFDVWFPMWTDDSFGVDKGVRDFAAWVDGSPVKVTTYYEVARPVQGRVETLTPWATWFVTFPPGQDVTIHVAYDVFPVGRQPYGTFYYILETGADWWGTIGEGTITFRLPYEVNETNVALNPGSSDLNGSTSPVPDISTVSGRDITWHFTDLEPTAGDNIRLTVLDPAVWREIAAAQQAADANPESVQAQLKLAHVLYDGLSIYKGIMHQANSDALAAQSVEIYQQVIDRSPEELDVEDLATYLTLLYYLESRELDSQPDDVLILLEQALDRSEEVVPVSRYLGLLYFDWDLRYYDDHENAPQPSDALLSVVRKAQSLAPDQPYLHLDDWDIFLENRSVAASATPTPTARPPEPTSTPIMPSPTPQSQDAGTGGICPAALVPVVGIMAVGWIRRKRGGGLVGIDTS